MPRIVRPPAAYAAELTLPATTGRGRSKPASAAPFATPPVLVDAGVVEQPAASPAHRPAVVAYSIASATNDHTPTPTLRASVTAASNRVLDDAPRTTTRPETGAAKLTPSVTTERGCANSATINKKASM